MPSILIKEQDLTTGGVSSTNFEVVYVPGYMTDEASAWQFSGNDADYSLAAKAKTPILCQSVSEFEHYFGKEPHNFSASASGEADLDKSYIYAKELLKLGLSVLYESMNGKSAEKKIDTPDNTNDSVSTYINGTEFYGKAIDKSEYQFKYLTSGGYATYEDATYTQLVSIAETRGDCIVLIDHQEDIEGSNKYENFKAFYEAVCATAKSLSCADQCAVFTPWVTIDCPIYTTTTSESGKNTQTLLTKTVSMPPSFAYLSALAKSNKTNPSWLAIAGATRGQIPNLNGDNALGLDKWVLSNSVAESFQNRGESTSTGVSINAITNIKPFGYRIWGNRTLKDNTTEGNLTATSFLNTRNMICDVKKVVFEACKKYMFEQNNDVLWLNFKAYIEPTLEAMKAGAGLGGYKIIKVETTAEKGKLEAVIKLYPLYAVEDFDITVQMLDDEISVS